MPRAPMKGKMEQQKLWRTGGRATRKTRATGVRVRTNTNCSKKRKYIDEATANAALAHRKAQRAEVPGQPPFEVYHCRRCSYFHMGNRRYT